MADLKLINTDEVLSEIPGMTRYALMRGYKEGRYPAISIGCGRGSKLKWNLEMLQEAIRNEMILDQQARQQQVMI